MRSKLRGVALVELLAASLIVAVALGGLFALWTVAMAQIQRSHLLSISTQLARADLEKVKVQGFTNLRRPTGATFTTGTRSIDGVARATAAWTGTMEYYDVTGALLTNGQPVASRRFTLVRYGLDVGVTVVGSNYVLSPTALREVRVTVTDLRDAPSPLTMGTALVKGGL